MPNLLTIKEAAQILGVTARTLYNKMNAGKVAWTMVCGRRYILRDALEEEARRNRMSTWDAEIVRPGTLGLFRKGGRELEKRLRETNAI